MSELDLDIRVTAASDTAEQDGLPNTRFMCQTCMRALTVCR